MIDTSMLKGTAMSVADVLNTKDLTQRYVDTIAAFESLHEKGAIEWNGEMRWSPRQGNFQTVFVAVTPPPELDPLDDGVTL